MIFPKGLRIFHEDSFTVFVLLFTAFTWYYMTNMMLNGVLSNFPVSHMESLGIWIAYYAAIVFSSIASPIISERINRVHFLYLWTLLGVITAISVAFLSNLTSKEILILSMLLGSSFGLGMPSCLAYFADHTLVENRGKMGGIVWLITNICAPLFAFPFAMFNLMVSSLFFALWRGLGVVQFFLLKIKVENALEKKRVSYSSVLRNRSFLLYFAAWFMFRLIDRFEEPVLMNSFGLDFLRSMSMVGPILASLSALIGGLLSDSIGRKRVVIYGFVALGLAYGFIGIAPTLFISRSLYVAIDGIAAGMLWVTFILVLWGDLSKAGAREKYYIIGSLPFFISDIIPMALTPVVVLIPEIRAFSLASFFLFLAVLPLLFAPETLPAKKIELRKLKKYVEAAKEFQEKNTSIR